MSTSITATSASTVTDTLFAKLDTKQKGYIDEADLQSAAGAGTADASATAELFKQLDNNDDGKVTKSELSVATEQVGAQLAAQVNQSQTSAASTTDGTHSAKAEAAHAHRLAGGGAPPGKSGSTGSSDSATTTQYVAAADTNSDGTVSADEDAAFKKLAAAAAEAKAVTQAQEYKDNSDIPATTTSSSVNVSA
jgi:hypothetical protein